MKKAIYLVSAIFLLVGCASSPKNKTPIADSIVKLHRAKEIQCSFTKGVEIEIGELEADKLQSDEDAEIEIRMLLKIYPKSDNVAVYEHEDAEDPDIFTSKMQKWERGISFIVYVEGWGIATITVFNIEDIPADYGATLSYSEMESDPFVLFFWGSCKVIE